ncbi:MAG: diadenylate cyclase [Bacteroidales bacterium]|nr:diadenylate cyclase [Bacteroidales bacterium]
MVLDIFGFLHLSPIDVLDIVIVAVILFIFFRWMKGTAGMNIFIAIILVLVANILARALNMKMISSLLGAVLDVGAIAIIVIFQPEIRRFLYSLGRSAGTANGLLGKILPGQASGGVDNAAVSEIARACMEMGETKTGALIVLRRKEPLEDIISTGDTIDAEIRCRLIENIFFKNSPLHDGAMIIGGNRIVAARCTLPISERHDLPASFGMRHKAAVGLSEKCDAGIVIVSEQTGKISFASHGTITEVKSETALKLLVSGEQQRR